MSAHAVWVDTSLPRRGANVVIQRARDELVLLDLETGRYYTLEGAGDRIWDLCDGRHSLADIVITVSEASGADVATVRADTTELLDRLRAEGLIDDAR